MSNTIIAPTPSFDYMVSQYFNIQPSSVKARATQQSAEHARYLWNKLYSCFEFTLPSEWRLNYFRYWLFHYGSIAVIYTNEFGWVCQPYQILEHDLYFQPKKIQVYNSFIKQPKVGLIDVNAGIIKTMDDYYGLSDIVDRYAVQLAEIDKAIHVNLMNTNTSVLFEVESKKQADEVKEAYARASTGEPFVTLHKGVVDKSNGISTLLHTPTNNYITDKLLDARATVVKQFLTEIGIPNANTEKKERLISDEVNQNNAETDAIYDIIYKNIKDAMDRINEFSGLGLDVKKRYENKEVSTDAVHSVRS